MSFLGRIKSLNFEKGYGFVDCAETQRSYSRDVFLHPTKIGEDLFKSLKKGEEVTFTVMVDSKGQPQAQTVTNDRLLALTASGRLGEAADPTPVGFQPGVNDGYSGMGPMLPWGANGQQQGQKRSHDEMSATPTPEQMQQFQMMQMQYMQMQQQMQMQQYQMMQMQSGGMDMSQMQGMQQPMMQQQGQADLSALPASAMPASAMPAAQGVSDMSAMPASAMPMMVPGADGTTPGMQAAGQVYQQTISAADLPKEEWICRNCGWRNRPSNTVCGGGQPGFGCGAPRLPPGAGATPLGGTMFGTSSASDFAGESGDAKRRRTELQTLQTMYDTNTQKRRRDPAPNPGLNPNLPTYHGIVKQPPSEDTGYGFIKSPEMMQMYGRDAFLHNKNCPWIFGMNLQKDEMVLFQVETNDKKQPVCCGCVKPPAAGTADGQVAPQG